MKSKSTAGLLAFFLTIGMLFTTVGYSQTPSPHPYRYRHTSKRPAVATVLICGGRSAYAYHSSECHGLNRCQSEVSRVSVNEARNMGYRPCKICY
jgi:hypothetical protein